MTVKFSQKKDFAASTDICKTNVVKTEKRIDAQFVVYYLLIMESSTYPGNYRGHESLMKNLKCNKTFQMYMRLN